MMSSFVSDREQQALREAGRTEISRPRAWCLVALFLVTIAAVPGFDASRWWTARRAESGQESPSGESAVSRGKNGATERLTGIVDRGPLALSRALDRWMRRIEDDLEESSVLRHLLLPPVQLALSSALGLGNEQVYPGRHRWLFYRADVDHVVGPPFMDSRVLRDRARSGDSGTPAPVPDPLPALTALAGELSELGISLIVMPTPLKPEIYPDKLSWRFEIPPRPLRNPSFEPLVAELRARGITLFDPAPILLEVRREGLESYLTTDTHWTPVAVERVAAGLAELVRPLADLESRQASYSRRTAVVEGQGDIAEMLRLPERQRLFPRQRVETAMVIDRRGRLWKATAGAPVMLLGDSFTNVFSEPALGWGTGAGLAEQLSFELGVPLDRLALNAGGASAVRLALGREMRRDPRRFDVTRVLIYQFATRELSQGDWRPISLLERH